MIKSPYLRQRAAEMRMIRLNQPRVTREEALALFEQHRIAAAASRLALKITTSDDDRQNEPANEHAES
jgi:hypothetical protein